MTDPRDRQTTGLWIGVALALIGLAGIVLPPLAGVSGMGGGYALACVGLFILIAGLVTALVYLQRARGLARILAGDGTLARWIYTEAESQCQIDNEFRGSVTQNRALYFIMVAWFVVIVGALVAYDYHQNQEVNWPFAGGMLLIVLLLGIVAWVSPRVLRRRAYRGGREVIIGRSGLVLSGVLHSWAAPLSRLSEVSLVEDSLQTALEFSIRSAGWLGSSSSGYVVKVFVPPEQLDAARRVVIELNPVA